MEVAGVEAEQLPARHSVAHVELVGTDDVGLRADPEQLALDRIEVALRIDFRLGEHLVERFREQLARRLAIDGHVLVSVGNPDVGHAGRPLCAAERLADLAAGDAVFNPELADAFVAMLASVNPSAALGCEK